MRTKFVGTKPPRKSARDEAPRKTKFDVLQFKTAFTVELPDPKPPMHLLNLSSSQASTQAISDSNNQQSQFFRLPLEVTKKIFQEVVGGNKIHVTVPAKVGYRFSTRICPRPHDCSDISAPRFVPHPSPVLEGCFQKDHTQVRTRKAGSSNVREVLNLDVLRVCRRFYQDAVLLPFQCNDFIIDSVDHPPFGHVSPWVRDTTVQRFSDYLNRSHREAIKSLTIASLDHCVENNRDQIATFKGLKKLHIVMAASRPFTPTSIRDLLDREWHYAEGYDFSRLRLDHVRITLEAHVDRRRLEHFKENASEVERLLWRIETRLIRSCSHSAQLKQHLMDLDGEDEQEDGTGFKQCLERLTSERRHD